MYQYSLAYVIKLFTDTIRYYIKSLERDYKRQNGLDITPESSEQDSIMTSVNEEDQLNLGDTPSNAGGKPSQDFKSSSKVIQISGDTKNLALQTSK